MSQPGSSPSRCETCLLRQIRKRSSRWGFAWIIWRLRCPWSATSTENLASEASSRGRTQKGCNYHYVGFPSLGCKRWWLLHRLYPCQSMKKWHYQKAILLFAKDELFLRESSGFEVNHHRQAIPKFSSFQAHHRLLFHRPIYCWSQPAQAVQSWWVVSILQQLPICQKQLAGKPQIAQSISLLKSDESLSLSAQLAPTMFTLLTFKSLEEIVDGRNSHPLTLVEKESIH